MATDTITVTINVEDLQLLYEAVWFYAVHEAKSSEIGTCNALLALLRK